MLQFEDVTFGYGDRILFDHYSLSLPDNSVSVLQGPSGRGKTTLLHLAAGLLVPTSGKITTGGAHVSVVFQEPRLIPQMTALENVNLVLGGKKQTLPVALDFLARAGLADASGLLPRELSGGMAKRVAIARALAFGGEVLLIDEPLGALDPESCAHISALICENAPGKTVLLVLHDRAERYFPRARCITL